MEWGWMRVRDPRGVGQLEAAPVQAGRVSGLGRPQEGQGTGRTPRPWILEDRGNEAGVSPVLCCGLLGL